MFIIAVRKEKVNFNEHILPEMMGKHDRYLL